MSDNMYNLEVDICGQKLTLYSDIGDEHIKEVSEYVDNHLRNIKVGYKTSTNKFTGVMLGITIADEFFIYKREQEKKLAELREEANNNYVSLNNKLSNKEKEFVKYIENISEIEGENERCKDFIKTLKSEKNALETKKTQLIEDVVLLKELNNMLKEENDKLKKEIEKGMKISVQDGDVSKHTLRAKKHENR